MDFAGGHAFTYSSRPGTGAACLAGQVRHEVRKERNAILRELFKEGAKVYRRRFVGQETSVLWESVTQLDSQGWQLEGLTGNYLRVEAVAPQPRWNHLDRVKLTRQTKDGLVGEIL
jgi:threonylcarbamoyladenosine tRNA methylthiotransferase MtaB